MLNKLSRIIAVCCVAGMGFTAPASAQLPSGLSGYIGLACAPGMEASAVQTDSGYEYYYCTWSSGYGCSEGQNCPEKKCKYSTNTWAKGLWESYRGSSIVYKYACFRAA